MHEAEEAQEALQTILYATKGDQGMRLPMDYFRLSLKLIHSEKSSVGGRGFT